MDSSHLVKAHDHARAAAVATQRSADTTVAINEHAQAAGEFAQAAHTTNSLEALRTLKLLEDHHRRLAELLRLPTEPTTSQDSSDGRVDDNVAEKGGLEQEKETDSKRQGKSTSEFTAKKGQLPVLNQPRRHAAREMSSSIASHMASARGIRGKQRAQALAPSMSNDQAPGNLDPHPRRDGSRSKMQDLMEPQTQKPTWVPPQPPPASQREVSTRSAAASPRTPSSPSTPEDGGYTRFYNTFGSLINKISAPLAFAGLPLIQEESTMSEQPTVPQEPTTSQRNSSRTSRQATKPSLTPQPSVRASSSIEPDLSKIYSQATMRALAREGHTANDSFYVVPTSGHTMSYANILHYAEKEKRRMEASSHHGSATDEDDFVDARESPMVNQLSIASQRRVGKSRTEKDLVNTVEELHLQNESLKDALDKLTKRLHAFEASAQNQSMAMSFMRPTSPVSIKSNSGSGIPGAGLVGGGGSQEEAMKRRQIEMEEQLANAMKHVEGLERDNRKMQKTLEKYRDKWELLKAGAKARREAQGSVEEEGGPS